jgi:hypothetical protein
MRHRISLLSTGIALGLIAFSAGSAKAQDVTAPKVNAKTLQKQCLALAQRDSAKDNSNMAAPAPVVSDSLRAICDSVNAANPEFKNKMKDKAHDKAKPNYPEPTKPADSMSVPRDTTAMSPASPASTTVPATGATPAIPATPATPADPSKPKDGASTTTTPQ